MSTLKSNMNSEELFELAKQKRQEELAEKHNQKLQKGILKQNIYCGETVYDMFSDLCGNPTQTDIESFIEALKNIEPMYKVGRPFINRINEYGTSIWHPEGYNYDEYSNEWALENLEITDL